MVNSPNWTSTSLQLGNPKPGLVDAGKFAADGTTVTGPSIPVGSIAQFHDTGSTHLGSGTFIFLPGVTGTVAGDMVTYRISDGAVAQNDYNYGAATERWVGTANTGAPLAVATAATNLQSTWGWYQIQGAAIINISGTVTAGSAAYYAGQAGVIETASAVAGKQVVGARSTSASGVPTTGQAIFTINNPVVQSAIT